jgi:hypothetical protein
MVWSTECARMRCAIYGDHPTPHTAPNVIRLIPRPAALMYAADDEAYPLNPKTRFGA